MISRPISLDRAFIESQRQKLLAERAQLSSAIDREDDEDRSIHAAAEGQANVSEDLAEDLTISENNRVLSGTLDGRRFAIDRALDKIKEGTYGLSDVSGEPIGLARLEAFPAALCTIDEEADLGPQG
jgi:DnaK suppressor protein